MSEIDTNHERQANTEHYAFRETLIKATRLILNVGLETAGIVLGSGINLLITYNGHPEVIRHIITSISLIGSISYIKLVKNKNPILSRFIYSLSIGLITSDILLSVTKLFVYRNLHIQIKTPPTPTPEPLPPRVVA